ncbi:MAG: hypothetical protein HC844_15870 [Tabrizicola sp.]|nr:hypothetical protein [Tabrizicola sp.]
MPEVDAVIAGHSHLAFPGPGFPALPGVDPELGRLAGKPAVMPGHSGSHIGIIDLVLSRDARHFRGGWRVKGSGAKLIAAGDPCPHDRLLQGALEADHRATLAWSRRPIGETRVPLHTHFATVAPSSAMELIAAAKIAHARRALYGTAWEDLPLLASVAPFRAGGRGGPGNFTDIAAGAFRMRSLSDLYAFPNTLVTLAVSGAEITDWLEQSAALFRQITPGSQDSPLLRDDMPSFTFEVIPGLDYQIDLGQPARFDAHGTLVDPGHRRIRNLCHQGKPVDGAARFLLVTNNHRAGRLRAGAGRAEPEVVLADRTRTRDVIGDYFRSEELVGGPATMSWSFAPMPQTTVTIAAGTGSDRYLSDIARYRPEPTGSAVDGFHHYRLHL